MVVNLEFVELLRNVRRTKDVHVEYEKCLSVPSLDHQTMSDQIRAPWLFNLDPLALLFMLKEKNRAQDFFNKINRDGDSVLSYEEFKDLFKVRVNLKHDCSKFLKKQIIHTVLHGRIFLYRDCMVPCSIYFRSARHQPGTSYKYHAVTTVFESCYTSGYDFHT